MIILDSQMLPVVWLLLGIMPGKKKGPYINQVCKMGWVVLKPTRWMIHLLLPMPPIVLKTATILEFVDAVVVTEEVVVVFPDVAAVGFEFDPPPEDITVRKVAFPADVDLCSY
jgi:hypothetical protein